jgi:tRNA threonylcarbamoyladenosine biosynthesis protein TsaE
MTTHITRQPTSAKTDDEMQALGAKLAASMLPGQVVYLCGSLGAGKTTFVRGFLRRLGYEGKVKSPTYTLVEPYETEKFEVFHFDLYRLNDPAELAEIGLEDYFKPSAVCLVEWPDKGGQLLPSPDLVGYFDIIENTTEREIRFEARTQSGVEILAGL